MAYRAHTPNRVTLAIERAQLTFTRAEIMRDAGVSGGAITRPLREMERHGMIEEIAVGKHGAKTWRKTATYQPPQGPVRLGSKTALHAAGETRQRDQAAALDAIGQCLKGWLPRSTRAATADQEAACA